MDGHSDLVARRHRVHGRVLQERREADLRQGRVAERSGPPLQLGLDGNVRRAIGIPQGAEVDASAFKALIRQAVALNSSGMSKSSRKAKSPGKIKDGAQCTVIAGTHKGKSGTVRDIKTSKTGHVTITVVRKNGERFKTLARNVQT